MNKNRFKNIWFYIGIIGVILSAMGVSPEMFTDWSIVWQQIKVLFSNPFLLCSVCVAVLGVFIDPTTKGISDNNDKGD